MSTLLEKPLEISKDHYLLKIDIGSNISIPGQFANIRISQNTDPLIRRPFSIFDHYNNTIELVIKEVGRGTKYIVNNIQPGNIDVIAPLGNGFPVCKETNVLLIGGGVGNAPLYYLAKELKKKKILVTYLFAAKSAEYIFYDEKYSEVADNYYTSTDDGTSGFKGMADEIVKKLLMSEKFEKIYLCGPLPMMKSIAEFIKTINTPFEVSLENYFGCGVGLCSGCTVETKEGMLRACIEGPVFDGGKIKWDTLN